MQLKSALGQEPGSCREGIVLEMLANHLASGCCEFTVAPLVGICRCFAASKSVSKRRGGGWSGYQPAAEVIDNGTNRPCRCAAVCSGQAPRLAVSGIPAECDPSLVDIQRVNVRIGKCWALSTTFCAVHARIPCLPWPTPHMVRAHALRRSQSFPGAPRALGDSAALVTEADIAVCAQGYVSRVTFAG